MQSNLSEVADTEVDIGALRAEVDKWQERVPKLAAALRERTDELAAARDEIRKLQQSPQIEEQVDARLKSRDGLIQELEEKLTELNASYQKASGDLHSSELGRTSAQEDSEKWKRKWQELSDALDEEASRRSDLDKERTQLLAKFDADSESLKQTYEQQLERREEDNQNLSRRNEQLLESMELANKQIAGLGDDLSDLIAKVEAGKETQRSLEQALSTAQAELAEKNSEVQNKSEKLEAVQAELSEAKQSASEREDSLQIELEELQDKLDGVTQEQLQDQAEWSTKLANGAASLEALQSEFNQAKLSHESELKQIETACETKIEQSKTAFATELAETKATLTSELEEATNASSAVQRALDATRELLASQEAKAAEKESVLNSQAEEIQRLEKCVQDASLSLPRVEKEKSLLSQQIAERYAELTKVRANLAERSALVMELEAEKQARKDAVDEREVEFDRLRLEAETAMNRATTFQQHNETLETRIQEQRSLLEDLERDLSQEQSKAVDARRALEADERLRRDLADELDKSLQKEHDKAEAANQRADELQEQLAESQEQLVQAEEELAEAQSKAERVEEDLEAAKHSLEDQQSAAQKVNELEAELKEANHKLSVADQASKSFAADQAELHEIVGEKDAALKHAKAELIALRAESVDGATVQHLKDQMRDLEFKLRDRTQELDDMRWRESQQSSEAEVANSESVVMVLNQQLSDARSEIERLKAARKKSQRDGDDLTELHGVGDKLAEQLKELGIESFKQIAALKEAELEDEEHKLHHLKSRILRDEWIDQAKALQ